MAQEGWKEQERNAKTSVVNGENAIPLVAEGLVEVYADLRGSQHEEVEVGGGVVDGPDSLISAQADVGVAVLGHVCPIEGERVCKALLVGIERVLAIWIIVLEDKLELRCVVVAELLVVTPVAHVVVELVEVNWHAKAGDHASSVSKNDRRSMGVCV